MKKVAIIAQRYGNEVNGGAEYHARILAEQLAHKYDITVLTTTAIDYHSGWQNHYPQGETNINGIKVIRFPTIQLRPKKFRKARRAILKQKKYFKYLKFLGLYDFCERHFNITQISPKDIQNWIIAQGPYCPDLMSFLKRYKEEYDVFIFFTYLYYPTVVGMPLVKEKALFIPTAHDEPLLYTPPYENLFSIPQFIMYNTESEKKLVENHFKNCCSNSDVAGVGIEKVEINQHYTPPPELKYDAPYFVYIGRIDTHKGCDELVKYFSLFSSKYPDIKLVMIGKDCIGIPPNEQIILTGFINEEDKYYLLRNSLGLILPSQYESLSLVTLEAMISGKIPIVNGKCDVLKQHIDKSQAGFYYTDYTSFEKALEKVLQLSESERTSINNKAQQYVKYFYSWDKVLEKFDNAFLFIETQNKKG